MFVSAPDESTSSIDASIILSETTSKNNSGTATNSAKDKKYSVGIKFAEVNYGPPGVGLKVVIQLHDGCAEPRPQGGSIYFFPKYAADEADCFADQKRMIESFGMYYIV